MGKNFLFILLPILLTIVSCGKNEEADDTPTPTVSECLLTEVNVNNDDYVQRFYYDQLGRFIKSDEGEEGTVQNYSLAEYNSKGQIAKLVHHDADGTPTWHTAYEYNSAGLLVNRTDYDSPTSSATAISTTVFEYSSPNQLSKASITSPRYGSYNLTFEYSKGSMVKVHRYSTSGTLVGTTEYEYDDKKGFGVTMPAALVLAETGEWFPFLHNITRETYVNASTGVRKERYAYTYEYNSDGYPTKMTTMDREQNYTYTSVLKYDCK